MARTKGIYHAILMGVLSLGIAHAEPAMAEKKLKKAAGSTSKKKKKKDDINAPASTDPSLPAKNPKEDPPLVDTSVPKPTKSKEILGNLGLMPFMPSQIVGFGGTFGLGLNESLMLQGQASYASGVTNSIAATLLSFGARAKKSFGKLFYGAGGGEIRMASGRYKILSLQNPDTVEYEGSASTTSIALTGAGGCQFHFGSFVIESDLLAISFPLMKFAAKETLPEDPDYDPDDAAAQKSKFDKLGSGMTISIKVGAGITF